MIMDVRTIYVGADDKGVIALGEAFGKLHADAVGLLRRALARVQGHDTGGCQKRPSFPGTYKNSPGAS